MLQLEYDPQCFVENVGGALGVVSSRDQVRGVCTPTLHDVRPEFMDSFWPQHDDVEKGSCPVGKASR